MKFSADGLAKAGRTLIAPFGVDVLLDRLDDDDEPDGAVEFKHVARVLPGRRVSGIATFQDGTYFVKIFYGPKARRYWQREIWGAQKLADAGVACAQLLRQGATADGAGFVIVYQALCADEQLDDAKAERFGRAVDLLAQMHTANLIQTDVHLGNFVIAGNTMYAVDADGIRPAQLLRVQFANLGMLLAQRRPVFDVDVPELWRRYAASRGDYVTRMGSAGRMVELVKKQRAHRVRRYLDKTLRECSEFHRVHNFRTNVLCERTQWRALQRLCLFPETVFGDGVPVKLGNSATVVRLDVDGDSYIVKRYNVKGLLHRCKRWFKKRARNAWRNGHRLAFLGIPTARPVALVEKRIGWFVGVCYLVMPDCGRRDLGQALIADPSLFDAVAPPTIDILQQLAAAGLAHGDLKATNFILADGTVTLIDYDAVKYGDNDADLRRFMRNWQESEVLAERWRRALVDRGLAPCAPGDGRP